MNHMHIRKTLAFAAVMAGFTMVATGYGADTDTNKTSGSQFKCELFSVDTDASQMVVSQGKLGSGNSGSDKTAPSKPCIVKVTKNTVIHWQDMREPISLRDLRESNIKQLNIPMTVKYDSFIDSNGDGTPERCTATEIIVMKTASSSK